MGNIFQKKLPCLKDNYTTFMGCGGCCKPAVGLFIYSFINLILSIIFVCGSLWAIGGIFLYILLMIAVFPVKGFPPNEVSGVLLRIGNMLYILVLLLDTAWLIQYSVIIGQGCAYKTYRCSSWATWNLVAVIIRIILDYCLGYFIMSSTESVAKERAGSKGDLEIDLEYA